MSPLSTCNQATLGQVFPPLPSEGPWSSPKVTPPRPQCGRNPCASPRALSELHSPWPPGPLFKPSVPFASFLNLPRTPAQAPLPSAPRGAREGGVHGSSLWLVRGSRSLRPPCPRQQQLSAFSTSVIPSRPRLQRGQTPGLSQASNVP